MTRQQPLLTLRGLRGWEWLQVGSVSYFKEEAEATWTVCTKAMLETQCQLRAHYEPIRTLSPSKGAAQIWGALQEGSVVSCLQLACVSQFSV